jgi:FtsZ-binding cell division protein ZapB
MNNLISLVKKLFNIEEEKQYFEFSYDAKKTISEKDLFNELNVLSKRENPIIYVEDVTDCVFKLINENTVFESQNIGDGNNEINVIEFQGKKYLDPFKANKTIDSGLIMSNNVNDENNKIENSKNEEINIKESLKVYENELKKTEIKINEEIYTINLLKEEIEFLKDISNVKIPKEFPELKNKITTLQKENEEIKESNKIQIDKLIAENEMLKKKVEENEKIINDLRNKNNTIEELEKKNSQLKIEIELNRKLSMEEINDMKIENDNLIHETNKLKEENENNINEALNLKTVLDLVKGDLKKKEKELIEKKNKEEEMVKGFENYKKKVNEIKESFLNKIKELEEDNLEQNI